MTSEPRRLYLPDGENAGGARRGGRQRREAFATKRRGAPRRRACGRRHGAGRLSRRRVGRLGRGGAVRGVRGASDDERAGGGTTRGKRGASAGVRVAARQGRAGRLGRRAAWGVQAARLGEQRGVRGARRGACGERRRDGDSNDREGAGARSGAVVLGPLFSSVGLRPTKIVVGQRLFSSVSALAHENTPHFRRSRGQRK
jgi:hypothetical protein